MSEDTFANCVALKLAKPIDGGGLYETLYDYLDETYGSYVYSINFGKDFIALYQDQGSESQYGITRIDIDNDFHELWDILMTLCNKHEMSVMIEPKYFTDFWYNGADCSVVHIEWSEL